ncbi:MAG: hypothetical protein U0163_05385 [Gemmatimonadaceae bacterium]
MILAVLLGIAGWRLLGESLTHGEGAAAGVAVFLGAIWYGGHMCAALAIIVLVGRFIEDRSLADGGFAALALVVLGGRMMMGQGPRRPEAEPGRPAARESSASTTPPRATYTEGYAWAMDNGLQSEADCTNGATAFIDGCKAAIRRQ